VLFRKREQTAGSCARAASVSRSMARGLTFPAGYLSFSFRSALGKSKPRDVRHCFTRAEYHIHPSPSWFRI